MKILITSGGTKIPIDSVRHIGNMSSGTFGSRIGYEALRAGHLVTFLHAQGSKTPLGLRFDGSEPVSMLIAKTASNIRDRMKYGRHIRLSGFSDFDSYENRLRDEVMFGDYDAVVLAAAVSDYDVVNKVDGKIRTKVNLTIDLKPLPKLISRIRAWRPPLSSHMTLVGFKLLVSSTMAELTDAARASMVSNQCDIVIANDLRDIKASKHMILIIKPDLTMTAHSHPSDPNALARRVIREIEGDQEWHLKKD